MADFFELLESPLEALSPIVWLITLGIVSALVILLPWPDRTAYASGQASSFVKIREIVVYIIALFIFVLAAIFTLAGGFLITIPMFGLAAFLAYLPNSYVVSKNRVLIFCLLLTLFVGGSWFLNSMPMR